MTDLASILMRKSLGALKSDVTRCSACHRMPLVGERLHELESGRILCDLCLAALPEEDRRAIRSERVRASERPLAVVPRAA
jgi:hypothetical protein